MNRYKIIEQLAKERTIEKIISNISKGEEERENLEELAQDIYLELLDKTSEELIAQLYKDNQLIFYITRIIILNIRSKTSPYYYKYKIDKTRSFPIDKLMKKNTNPYNEEEESY